MEYEILSQPALKPPPGVRPNFVDPPNLKTPFTAIIISLLVLNSIAVGSRIYTKAVVVRKLALEDC